MRGTLYVALLWHMHQPCYRDPASGEYRLPWVRLRAAKDYLHMPRALEAVPEARATFNLVPVLLEQLEDYARGAEDSWMALARRAVGPGLAPGQLRTAAHQFFAVNHSRILASLPIYQRLRHVLEGAHDRLELLSRRFWADAAVWHNLAWIDPEARWEDPELAAVAEHGRDFRPEQLELVFGKQRQMAGEAVDAYRRVAASGQAELSVSPYYHPILPLLVDTESAGRALPDAPLPAERFSHPQDASLHIRAAVEAHERRFGQEPAGMWPSEGSVSPEMMPLVAREGICWLVTDEAILACSVELPLERDEENHLILPEMLYQPYRFGAGPESVALFFRDRFLSDEIGFAYKHWRAEDAADDLVARLLEARERLPDDGTPYIVTIGLDGDNCWDEYHDNGSDFLRALYRRLSTTAGLEMTTFSGYLEQHEPRQELTSLWSGSWIGADFSTWIGFPEQNRAWELLAHARATVGRAAARAPEEAAAAAWRSLLVAEGSDWFWWYCPRNHARGDTLFDELFRRNLIYAYRAVGRRVPQALRQPILA